MKLTRKSLLDADLSSMLRLYYNQYRTYGSGRLMSDSQKKAKVELRKLRSAFICGTGRTLLLRPYPGKYRKYLSSIDGIAGLQSDALRIRATDSRRAEAQIQDLMEQA